MVLKWLVYLTGSRTSQEPVAEEAATIQDEASFSILNGQASQGETEVDGKEATEGTACGG